jgi:hypothetical protein
MGSYLPFFLENVTLIDASMLFLASLSSETDRIQMRRITMGELEP